MAKPKRRPDGDIVQIPLEDGSFGYGKVLPNNEVSFLDYRTTTKEFDLATLERAANLFRVWVMHHALAPRSNWKTVASVELSEDEKRPSTFYRKDALTGALSFYRVNPAHPKGFETEPAGLEECKNLERAAGWEPSHIESRLLDHFMGRKNKWVEQLRL